MKIIFVTLFFVAVASAEFPNFITLCKRDSKVNDCLKENINRAKCYLKQGILSLFSSKMKPLEFESEVVVPTAAMNFTLRKGFVYAGLDNFVVNNINLDFDKNILTIDWVWNRVFFNGNYKIEGKMLDFDLNGGGECWGKLDNVGVSLKMIGNRKQKEGKNYIIFEKNDLELELSQLTGSFYFADLLPSIEQTNYVNKILNDNSKPVVAEFQPVVEIVIVAPTINSIRKMFELYSIDQLLSD